MHRLTAIGRLTRDPEMRYTTSGKAVTNINLAVNDGYFNENDEYVERTIWMRLTCWGSAAERANRNLAKGDLIYFEGRIVHEEGNPRVWVSDNGEPHASFEVNCSYYLKVASPRSKVADEAPEGEELEEEISL